MCGGRAKQRGYAGADFIACRHAHGCEAVIPPHHSAKLTRDYAARLYRERHLVDCCLNKLKRFRRNCSHFGKLDRSYRGFVHFVEFICALVWLR